MLLKNLLILKNLLRKISMIFLRQGKDNLKKTFLPKKLKMRNTNRPNLNMNQLTIFSLKLKKSKTCQ